MILCVNILILLFIFFLDKLTYKEKLVTSYCGLRVFRSAWISGIKNNIIEMLTHFFIHWASRWLLQQAVYPNPINPTKSAKITPSRKPQIKCQAQCGAAFLEDVKMRMTKSTQGKSGFYIWIMNEIWLIDTWRFYWAAEHRSECRDEPPP